jgi:hypothetical protein
VKKCVLVVLSNPVAGREAEFNDWYSNQHLADVLKVPGFSSAQRFKLGLVDSNMQWTYLAIYEFEAVNPADALEALTARAGSPDMVISQTMDMQAYSAVPWVAITEKITASE